MSFFLRLQASHTAITAAAVLLSMAIAPAASANPDELSGLWWADSGSAQVEIRSDQGEFVGVIVWLRDPLGRDGRPLRDVNHPDPARHGQTVIGLEMLHGFRAESDEPGVFSGGRIYDPGNGRTYQGTIRLQDDDRLLLRGFIGISLLGRTTTWVRVANASTASATPVASTDARHAR